MVKRLVSVPAYEPPPFPLQLELAQLVRIHEALWTSNQRLLVDHIVFFHSLASAPSNVYGDIALAGTVASRAAPIAQQVPTGKQQSENSRDVKI